MRGIASQLSLGTDTTAEYYYVWLRNMHGFCFLHIYFDGLGMQLDYALVVNAYIISYFHYFSGDKIHLVP
jgi:hypothetical protein